MPTPATARSISGSIGDQPSVAVTIVDAFTVSSSWPRPCCSRPWATMVTAVTSATPIISALAVTAVRPGLRMALSRASRPAAPPSVPRACRRARRRRARRGRTGAPSRRCRRRAAPPRARSSSRGAPGSSRRAPSRACRRAARRRSCAPASETPSVGSCMPIAVNRLESPAARPRPAAMPTTEASRPISSASSSTVAAHLAARRADHPQQPELLRALRDGDRERVEDRERADEHGHAGEGEQHRAQDAHERLERVEGEAVVVGGAADLACPATGVDVRWCRRRGCGRSRPWRTASAPPRGRRPPRSPCRATSRWRSWRCRRR